ncbi:MAG: response regulator transcription factor [Saprospiraceae bacterium]|nr:response regulator transcription factor [Saprospiraceae bacterium]
MFEALRCLIVEDELLPAELLGDYIRQTPGLELAGVCTDALYAMDWLQNNHTDVIFLDIHLPQLKGLDFLSILKNPPLVVITTAYHEYAIDGYRFDVVDYLLKPYDFKRFLEALAKIQKRLISRPNAVDEVFFIKVNKQQIRIRLQEILFLESVKEYCKVHTTSKFWLTLSSLSAMEHRLPAAQFLRIHRSYLINTQQISAFSATEISLGNVVLPIGKTYHDAVAAFFKN